MLRFGEMIAQTVLTPDASIVQSPIRHGLQPLKGFPAASKRLENLVRPDGGYAVDVTGR